jgi:hypothetical protein
MAPKETTTNLKISTLLAKLVDEICEINEKLDSLIQSNCKLLEIQLEFLKKTRHKNNATPEFKLELDTMALLSLPMSLRKTVMVLYKLEKATAEGIAQETKRLRAVESASANQLVRMGYLKKKREGRDVYFYIEPPLETNE